MAIKPNKSKNIPIKLKIGGHEIKINIKELDNITAEFDPYSGTINIDSRLNESQQESALVHEIFHVMNAPLTQESNVLGHALIDSFSEQLYQILKDNKLHF